MPYSLPCTTKDDRSFNQRKPLHPRGRMVTSQAQRPSIVTADDEHCHFRPFSVGFCLARGVHAWSEEKLHDDGRPTDRQCYSEYYFINSNNDNNYYPFSARGFHQHFFESITDRAFFSPAKGRTAVLVGDISWLEVHIDTGWCSRGYTLVRSSWGIKKCHVSVSILSLAKNYKHFVLIVLVM